MTRSQSSATSGWSRCAGYLSDRKEVFVPTQCFTAKYRCENVPVRASNRKARNSISPGPLSELLCDPQVPSSPRQQGRLKRRTIACSVVAHRACQARLGVHLVAACKGKNGTAAVLKHGVKRASPCSSGCERTVAARPLGPVPQSVPRLSALARPMALGRSDQPNERGARVVACARSQKTRS